MNELDKYLNARAYEVTDTYAEAHKDEVLEFMLLRGVTYASEISRATSLHIDTIGKILNHCQKLGYIKNFLVDFDNPQRIFMPRLLELWAKKIYGAERIAMYSWWIITEGGFEYFKSKHTGESKKIIKSLITYYNWFLEEEEIELRPMPKEIKEIIQSEDQDNTDSNLQVEGGNRVDSDS